MACVQKHMNAQVPKHICKHDVTPERKIRRGEENPKPVILLISTME